MPRRRSGHDQRNGRCQAAFSSSTEASITTESSSPRTINRGASRSRSSRAAGHLAQPAERQAGEDSSSSPAVLGRDFEEEPGGRLGEQQDEIVGRVVLARARLEASPSRPEPPANAISASATARPPSLRSWQLRTRPGRDRRVERAEQVAGPARDRPGARGPPGWPLTSAQSEPPSSSRVVPRRKSRLPGSFRSIVTHGADVGHVPDRADQQRRRDREAPALVRVFVVQAVLAGDERRAVGQGHVAARLGGADQRAERLGPLGVAPAEVVEERDPRRDRRRRPRQLRTASSMTQPAIAIGIELAVARVDAAADGQAARRAEDRQDDRRVAGPVVAHADQRLDRRSAPGPRGRTGG